MDQQKNNSAKFAFFYLLSLASLIFLALSTGIIIFQIINKAISDPIGGYRGQYSPDALKFAISAVLIAAPLFYYAISRICKNLFSGALEKDSSIRKWLTYFIILVSSLVMAGWTIATVYSFLDGELTVKFILKAVTALAISAAIFSYFLYDIRREEVVGRKDKVVAAYFYASLAAVIIVFVAAFFFVESPTETRNRKYDDNIISQFSQIDGGINTYFMSKGKLPATLGELDEEVDYITPDLFTNKASGEQYGYRILDERTFELCATFKAASKDYQENFPDGYYLRDTWLHEAGYQCLKRKVLEPVKGVDVVPAPALKD